MGSVDDVLTVMLSDDHDPSSLAAVKTSSNSPFRLPNDMFALLPYSSSLQGSLSGSGQQLGSSKGTNFPRKGLGRSLAQIPEWPFPKDEKWGLDVLQEPDLTRATNFSPNVIAPQNMKTSRQGGLQRYHSAPSSFLQCLDDFINEPGAYPQASSPLPDSDGLLTWADNLAPIMERCSQQMDTEKILPSSELNDYEEFIATLTDFSTTSRPPESQKLDSKESLIRQDGLGGFTLPAIQDNMEESSDVTFQMPGFLPQCESMPGPTSEKNGATNNSKSSTYTPEECTYLVKEPAVSGGLWNCPTNPARVGEAGPKLGGLIRHSSLPAPSRPFSGNVDFDDLFADPSAVPLKTIRANRGHATHPRSIAERVRRGKISERMKKLQDLVPSMDRQTNTADMLDDAVEYVKQLQQQVQELSKTVAELQQLQERLGRRD